MAGGDNGGFEPFMVNEGGFGGGMTAIFRNTEVIASAGGGGGGKQDIASIFHSLFAPLN